MMTKTFVYFTTDKMFYVKTPSNQNWMFNRNNDKEETFYQCIKSIKETGNDAIRLLYLDDLNFLRKYQVPINYHEEFGYFTDMSIKIKVKERRF